MTVSSALLSEPFSTALSSKPSKSVPSLLQDSRNGENNEPQIQLSLDKLFVPPDTDVSSLKTPISARVLKGSNIVLSKYATDAQVESADFVKSSVKTEDCPSDSFPEFALVGRSNVGKSSLLNSLVRRKKLALTSKKPGKCLYYVLLCFLMSVWSFFMSFDDFRLALKKSDRLLLTVWCIIRLYWLWYFETLHYWFSREQSKAFIH